MEAGNYYAPNNIIPVSVLHFDLLALIWRTLVFLSQVTSTDWLFELLTSPIKIETQNQVQNVGLDSHLEEILLLYFD